MQVMVTVKEAVMLAQQGNNDAMIALLKRYQPIVYKGIGKAMSYGIDTEELDSIFTFEMLKMLLSFDVRKFKDDK